VYKDPAGLFELDYPTAWTAAPGGAYQSPTEFFRVRYLPDLGSHHSVFQVCSALANLEQGPTHDLSMHPIGSIPGCRMTPLYHQGYPSLIFQTRAKSTALRYVQLETAFDLDTIAQGLRLSEPPIASPALEPTRLASGIPWPVQPRLPAGITILEFPLGDNSGASPDKAIIKRKHIPKEWFGGRRPLRTPTPTGQARVDDANAIIQPFGYHLEKVSANPDLYELLRGQEILLDRVYQIEFSALDKNGKDFILLAQNEIFHVWVSQAGINPYLSGRGEYYVPIFVGDEWILVDYSPPDSLARVLNSEKELFRFAAPYLAGPPPISLWAWQSQWILEIDGFLVVDGVTLNRQLDVNEIFSAHVLGGEPFFFVSAEGQTGIVVGGSLTRSDPGMLLPNQYDEIYHYGCCGFVQNDPIFSDIGVAFLARRGSMWYEVVLEIGS